MLTVCWSPKGGSGTSVIAAALALDHAAAGADALLVDLGGDQPALLGLSTGDREGVADWLSAPDVPVDALAALERPVRCGLGLLERGGAPVPASDTDRLALMAEVFAAANRPVVLDVGTVAGGARWWRDSGAHGVVVIRPCYLAARRLIEAGGVAPDAVLVVIEEDGRVLRAGEIADAVGADRVVTVRWDPAVARAVDAGLITTRIPRSLRKLRSRIASRAPESGT